MYFETRVKVTSEGKRKAFNYLVDAMSFTEAEARTLKAVEGMADIEVEAVKRSKVSDLFSGSSRKFYKVRASHEPEDGKAETLTFIIESENETDAADILHDGVTDFTIESITKTKIVEVLR